VGEPFDKNMPIPLPWIWLKAYFQTLEFPYDFLRAIVEEWRRIDRKKPCIPGNHYHRYRRTNG
jgi:hypothetical protein